MNCLGWITVLPLASAAPETLVVPMHEVVVTGTRTPTSVLRTPAAVSVIDRRTYGDTRAISLQDALRWVPGVLVQSRAGAQDVRVTIRGFGARGNGERSNSGTVRGARVMTDGIPLTEPDGRTSLDLADLGLADRIEIARSNYSTLYGNASGGVVQLRTNLQFAEPYLEFRERAGAFGYHREQGVAGFVAGAGRGVVLLSNSTYAGWRAHSGSGATLASLRYSTPIDDRTRLGVLVDGVSDLNRFPGPLTQAELDSFPGQANASFVQRDERRRNRLGRVGLLLDRSFASRRELSANLFVEPKVLQRSERGRFRDFNRYHLGGSFGFQERRRLGPRLESVTLIGADEALQDGSILFYILDSDGSRGTTLVANKRESANGAGGFLQQDLTWDERWSLRLAARYDHIRYVSQDFQDPDLDAEKTFTRWTPKGSVSYAFDRHTLYAALGGGVEAPAFNEIDPPPPYDTLTALNPFLDAMHSTTFELGMKGDWIPWGGSGSIAYDLALYQIDVRNDIVPLDGGAYFLTAGRSRRRGFELGLDWAPRPPLSLNGALTLSDNEYLDYRNELGDHGGRTVPGLPSSAVALGARWRLARDLMLGISAHSVSEIFADDANTVEAPSYALVGASIAYERGLGSARARVFLDVDNLADRRYVASVFINPLKDSAGRPQAFEPGLPRAWSAGLTLRW